jgi:hypothetical protein
MFRSNEEWWFSWWLDELLDAGYVEDWEYESEVFTLSDPYRMPWEKKLKTKTKPMEHKLLEKCTYTPDFKIIWDESARGIFYHNIGDEFDDPKELPHFFAQENITHIEIKPNHDFQNKTQQAVIKMKWLMQLGTWCQLVIPSPKVTKGKVSHKNALFYNTFLPERYLYTDKSGQLRKINYKYITFKQWQDIRQ